ncbi:MAG: hypothetical protein IH612_15670 [Desulfofustis sp.]|nr:hypothetical protein [Desulfofustis sp.]
MNTTYIKQSLRLFSLLVVLPVALLLCGNATEASGEELPGEPDYKITGYRFDYDAVSESEHGLFLETSRFKPLMITNAATDLFGAGPFTGPLLRSSGKSIAPQGFAVAAEYLATPDLAFHGAIGVTKGNWDADAALETESSWEANIGVVYRLFNSLSYQVHFGYMDTGDLFKQADAYSEVESIIMISNQLTLSF